MLRSSGFNYAGNQIPSSSQLTADRNQAYKSQDSLSQTPEDKKQVKELLNLISQSLEEKKPVQENMQSPDRNFDDKAHVQEYVNLLSQSQVPIKKNVRLKCQDHNHRRRPRRR